MVPKYDLDKIKFVLPSAIFEKAVDLYDRSCVTQFRNQFDGYVAVVIGGNPYQVFVSNNNFDIGHCACYLGTKNTLCKHMVAVAIHAVKNGEVLINEEKIQKNELTFSGDIGELKKIEYSKLREKITGVMRYIKPYKGPSRIWFSY